MDEETQMLGGSSGDLSGTALKENNGSYSSDSS